MTAAFFAHVAPVYNFLDREYVESAINKRWQIQSLCDDVDSMLGGVAALGCLFSGRPVAFELQLVQSTRSALEYSSSLPCPRIDHVIGWLLRVIYLRATSSPHAAWMASCTLMHMIETTKLHLEPSENSILAQSQSQCAPDLRRRIYWVAQLFNIWVSSDYGKSRVELHGASSELPGEVWTTEQQELCYLSYTLAQDFKIELCRVEEGIADVCALSVAEPMLRLLQCNIGLDLAKTLCPWWHIINIPFQIVCVLLVIDNDSASSLLPEALNTLKDIVHQYKTKMVRESYSIACFLVSQEHQRRRRKLEHMANALEGHQDQLQLPGEPLLGTLTDTPYSLHGSDGLDTTDSAGFDVNIPLADYFLLDSILYDN
ncbi:hypothetical protein BDV18DRAFT_157372 [Aspergillus unguis]